MDRRRRAIAFLVAGCFFMENLDGTIVIVAAPVIARDLGVTSASVAITVTAFFLTVAVVNTACVACSRAPSPCSPSRASCAR